MWNQKKCIKLNHTGTIYIYILQIKNGIETNMDESFQHICTLINTKLNLLDNIYICQLKNI
jgi:hypothetical protein